MAALYRKSQLILLFFCFSPVYFPMGKQIPMAAPGALPGSLYWIGISVMDHLYNKMTMQTLGRFAVYELPLSYFSHSLSLTNVGTGIRKRLNFPLVKLRQKEFVNSESNKHASRDTAD